MDSVLEIIKANQEIICFYYNKYYLPNSALKPTSSSYQNRYALDSEIIYKKSNQDNI